MQKNYLEGVREHPYAGAGALGGRVGKRETFLKSCKNERTRKQEGGTSFHHVRGELLGQ